MSARFIGLPEPHMRATVYGLTLVFTLLFAICYVGGDYLSKFVPWRIDVAFEFERHIPFVLGAAAIYLSILPLLCLAPFVLREPRSIGAAFYALSTATLIGACIFLLLPVKPMHLELATTANTNWMFGLADWLNLDLNYLPSLHVTLASIIALAYGARVGGLGRGLLAIWVVAVAASTLLTHQHFLLDVLAGFVLAWFSWGLAKRRAPTSRFLTRLRVELICLGNFARFSLRHRRYAVISLGLIAKSFPAYGKRRLLRAGFAFLQAVDDLLDGDRPSEREPLIVVDELLNALANDTFADDDLSCLAKAFRGDLIGKAGEPALQKALLLMRTMQVDRRRVLSEILLDREALAEQLRKTFALSVDLMLIAADCTIRSAEVPELLEAFAWCSTVRDLDEDLSHGLVNIPKDIVESVWRQEQVRDPKRLAGATLVVRWLSEHAHTTHRLLDETDRRLRSHADRPGARILSMFSRSIRRYADAWVIQSKAISGYGKADAKELSDV